MAAVQISLPHYQYEVLTIPSHVVFQHLTSYNYLSDTPILLSPIDGRQRKLFPVRSWRKKNYPAMQIYLPYYQCEMSNTARVVVLQHLTYYNYCLSDTPILPCLRDGCQHRIHWKHKWHQLHEHDVVLLVNQNSNAAPVHSSYRPSTFRNTQQCWPI